MDTKGEGWQRRESSSSTSVQTRARLTQEDTEGVKLNDDRPEDSEQLSSS